MGIINGKIRDHVVAPRPACHGEDTRSASIKVALTGSAKRHPNGCAIA
jgi:hypothetical protein